jgi:hypothetical protein
MTYQNLRARAIQVLRDCCQAAGLRASGAAKGHHEVWTRDAMISLLGAVHTEDAQIQEALHASLSTLARHRTMQGEIPNNVGPSGKPNFRAYADSGLWWVIGSSILAPDASAISQILGWYACQDVDASGVISIQESSDWQDLFCTRGKGLYVNCVRVMALRRAAALQPEYAAHADTASQAINRQLWYNGDRDLRPALRPSFSTENFETDSLGRPRWLPTKRVLPEERYYHPYVSFRDIGEWFDTLGNLLAIISGVAHETHTGNILDLIARHGLAEHPAPAIYPPVTPQDSDWRPYYGSLNLPQHYHNGGIWPFIGGFYVAALVKAGASREAGAALQRLAALNDAGDFCEWHHGESLEPLGVSKQAWSAAMFLYACECVEKGSSLFW